MSEHFKDTSTEADPDIWIERVITEKTRKDFGSETVYHVYFKLSGHPPPGWRNMFGEEWKRLNLSQRTSIDGPFLVLHCQLPEVAGTLLPALKKAVAATGEAYKRYAQKEAIALDRRKEAWNQERKDVETMASSLRFD